MSRGTTFLTHLKKLENSGGLNKIPVNDYIPRLEQVKILEAVDASSCESITQIRGSWKESVPVKLNSH